MSIIFSLSNHHSFNIASNRRMNWIKQQPDTENDEKSANCLGTDPNRNWNYEWNRATSTEAEEVNGIAEQTAFQTDCSEFYPGPHAFSEPETRAVSAFLKENRKHIKVSRMSQQICKIY